MNIEKANILIIDDNEMNREVLSRRMEKSGFIIETAEDGTQGLEKIDKVSFDLILLDIILPDINGLDILRTIRGKSSMIELPVIMLSAKDESEDIVTCFEIGANDYITKPVNYPVLLARIRTQLLIKRMEETKENLVRELHKLNEDKDKFFSILSHDLRTPLTPIIGAAEMIIDCVDFIEKDQIKEYAEAINSSAEHLSNLLESILQWSGVQIGRIENEPENINLEELINENFEIYEANAQKKFIQLSKNLAENLVIYADRNMLSTVIRNLISNAIKFTPNGGKISISADKKDKCIKISVSDTGVGINKEELDKLFRIDTIYTTPGTKNEKGSGLGLILCKEFIEKNEGNIWIDSEPGEGTTFHFMIPAGTEEE